MCRKFRQDHTQVLISVYQNIFLTSTKTFWALAYFQFLAQLHTLPYNLIQFLCGKRPLFFGDPPHNKIKTIIFHFIYFQFLNTVVEKGNRDLVIFSKPLNLSYIVLDISLETVSLAKSYPQKSDCRQTLLRKSDCHQALLRPAVARSNILINAAGH